MTAPTPTDGASRPAAQRFAARSVAASLALLALAISQSPGFKIADTKLDLVINPGGALARALHMWDGQGAFGQVGNQAYGYLWPMGPFFWLGHLAEMPGWFVQRLWIGLVLVVAFQGAARLARALGVRSDLAVIVAALAYALSPRMITTVGPISIEAWPSAIAPWVLLALVLGSRQGSARRYALGAGLGVAMVGGVNAAATFAVIPLGAVWLLTRTRGPRRRTLMVWWPIFTLLGCLWWLVPLVVLGQYSPPFLDYIETADVTTYPTTLFDALRGTTAWIPYVESRWRAGNDLITIPILILNSTVLVVLGLVGIARRDNPHRTFLALGLLTGLLMVTFGHAGAQQGWFGPGQRDLLDGVLAPVRNVHKFDPVIRIPMILGLAHVMDRTLQAWAAHRAGQATDATASRRARFLDDVGRLGVVWLAVVALVGASLPALSGRLAPGDAFSDIPTYWRQTASWLAENDSEGRALLLPASSFGAYVWGATQDEPIQPIADSDWAVRNAIPLAPVGNIRALDALDERLARGEGSPALAAYLRRMGIDYLVLRNDLRRSSDVADPVLVHQALGDSPGLERVQSFGPDVGGQARLEAPDDREIVVNQGWQAEYPAVEIYQVFGSSSRSVTSRDLPVVAGAPEDLLSLTESGVLNQRPTTLGYDADSGARPTGDVVLTDGLRLRDRFFGRIHDGASETLTPQEAEAAEIGDYELTTDGAWRTTARLEGAAAIVASSSQSDARTPGGAEPAHQPYAAFDGDPATSWISRSDATGDTSLRLDLTEPTDVDTVTVHLGEEPTFVSQIRVRTENGVTDPVTVRAGREIDVSLPAGPTSWVAVEESSGSSGRQLAIAELEVPGVTVSRWLVPPTIPTAWGAPSVISLDARPDARTGCVEIGLSLRCAPGRQHEGGETSGMRRLVTLPEGATYDARLQVVPRAGSAISDLLQEDLLVNVQASSRSTTGVSASGPIAVIDDDPGTTWVSAAIDPSPSLDVSWLEKRTITGITLAMDPQAPARRPTSVLVSYEGGSQRVDLDEDGVGELRPVRVDRLSIVLDESVDTVNLDFDGTAEALGVGVSELSVRGLPDPLGRLDTTTQDFGCGSGPEFDVNGRILATAVVGVPAELHRGGPADLRLCTSDETVRLTAGENRISLGATDSFSPATVVLTRSGGSTPLPDVVHPAPTVDGALQPTPGDDTLVVRQNANDGWTATQGGTTLDASVVDGWQQAFGVDGTDAPVVTTYDPDRTYRLGLLVGGVLLVLLLLLYGWWRLRPPAPSRGSALRQSRWAAPVGIVGLAAASGLVAGWAGVAVFAGASVVLGWLRRRHREITVWVAVVPVALVGIWNAIEPWGSAGGWYGQRVVPQLVMVVALALLAVALLGDAPQRRGAREPRRSRRERVSGSR